MPASWQVFGQIESAVTVFSQRFLGTPFFGQLRPVDFQRADSYLAGRRYELLRHELQNLELNLNLRAPKQRQYLENEPRSAGFRAGAVRLFASADQQPRKQMINGENWHI